MRGVNDWVEVTVKKKTDNMRAIGNFCPPNQYQSDRLEAKCDIDIFGAKDVYKNVTKAEFLEFLEF